MSKHDEHEWLTFDFPVRYWMAHSAVVEVEDGLAGYMIRLYESLDDDTVDGTTFSGLPFCGCDVCQTRETLAWLVPTILTLQQGGLAGLGVRNESQGSLVAFPTLVPDPDEE